MTVANNNNNNNNNTQDDIYSAIYTAPAICESLLWVIWTKYLGLEKSTNIWDRCPQ